MHQKSRSTLSIRSGDLTLEWHSFITPEELPDVLKWLDLMKANIEQMTLSPQGRALRSPRVADTVPSGDVSTDRVTDSLRSEP